MPPKKSGCNDHGLVVGVAAFLVTGAYYFLSAQEIINNKFVIEKEVRHMVGLMYLSDVSFNLITAAVSSLSSSSRRGGDKKSKVAAAASTKPLEGWPKTCLYCLPLFDCTALILTFEAIRMAGSGFQQTVGGASIPISCVLNVLITGKRYSQGQLLGISLVIAGLAVKAKALMDGDMKFPLVPLAYVLFCNVCYAMRGITMEYLSKVPNPPSGERMTMQMGVTGLALWTLYTVVYTLPNFEELVMTPVRASNMSALKMTGLYLTHMLSRGMAGKTIMMVVRHPAGGATVLSLAQVVRSSLIIVLSSVLFCGSDPRQCLNGVGVVSVVLVVSGGAVYGVAKKVDDAPAKKSATTSQSKKLKSDDDAGDDDDTGTKTIASPAPTMVTRRRTAAVTAAKKSPRTKRMM